MGDLASDDPLVNLRITSYGEDEISVAWEIPHNRGITGYTLARRDHEGTAFTPSNWSTSDDVAGGNCASGSSTSLTADARYRFILDLKGADGTTFIE